MGDCQIFPLWIYISLFENVMQSLEWHIDPANIPIIFCILTDLCLRLLWNLGSPFHPTSGCHWHKSTSWRTQAEPYTKGDHPLVRALRFFFFSGSGCPSRRKTASAYSVLVIVLLMGRPTMRHGPSIWGAFNEWRNIASLRKGCEVTHKRGRKFYKWDSIAPLSPLLLLFF